MGYITISMNFLCRDTKHLLYSFVILLCMVQSSCAADLHYTDTSAYMRPSLQSYSVVDALMVNYFMAITAYKKSKSQEDGSVSDPDPENENRRYYNIDGKKKFLLCKTEYDRDNKDVLAYELTIAGFLHDAPKEVSARLTEEALELRTNRVSESRSVFFDDMTDAIGCVCVNKEGIGFGLSLRFPKQDQNRAMLVKYLAYLKKNIDKCTTVSKDKRNAYYLEKQEEAQKLCALTSQYGDHVAFKDEKRRKGIYELTWSTETMPYVAPEICRNAWEYLKAYKAKERLSSYTREDVVQYKEALEAYIPYFQKRVRIGGANPNLADQKKLDEENLQLYTEALQIFNDALTKYDTPRPKTECVIS